MDLAIKAHVAKHRRNEQKVEGNERTSGKLSQLLSGLTLKKVMEVQGSNFFET
jgi:hypothetical protein